MILNSLNDIRAFLPANVSTNFEDIAPFLETAETDFLLPEIGYTLLSTIQQLDNLTPAEKELKRHAGRVVAFYAFSKAIPFLAVKFGSNGITNIINETNEPAKKWQIETLQHEMRENAFNALDSMLQFLEGQEIIGKLTAWNEAENYINRKTSFIKTAKLFNQYIPINSSFLTFRTFAPYMLRAEMDFIRPKIGLKIFGEIKNGLRQNDLLPKYFALMPDLASAVANKTAQIAIIENRVLMQNNGFFVANFTDLKTQSPATNVDLQVLVDNYKSKAENDLQMALNIMINDIGQYPFFEGTAYFKSLHNQDFVQKNTDKSIFI